jgi:hypothetical protein
MGTDSYCDEVEEWGIKILEQGYAGRAKNTWGRMAAEHQA